MRAPAAALAQASRGPSVLLQLVSLAVEPCGGATHAGGKSPYLTSIVTLAPFYPVLFNDIMINTQR